MVHGGSRAAGRTVVLAALALGAVAHAGSAASEAQARFDEGRRLYRVEHDAAGALAKFAQAYALAPRHETLWNLALCELDLGRDEEAAAHLRRYARDPDAKAANVARVPALLATARAKLGSLRVEATLECVVRVDGRLVDPREWHDEPVDLAPGDHVVVVSRGGDRFEAIVAIRVGETTVHLGAPAARAEAPPDPLLERSSASSVDVPPNPNNREATNRGAFQDPWPLALGALGLVAAGGGVVSAMASRSYAADADLARNDLRGADCTKLDAPACDRLRSSIDAGNARAWLAIGGYATAAALVGTAAWLYWRPLHDDRIEARFGPSGFALRVRY